PTSASSWPRPPPPSAFSSAPRTSRRSSYTRRSACAASLRTARSSSVRNAKEPFRRECRKKGAEHVSFQTVVEERKGFPVRVMALSAGRADDSSVLRRISVIAATLFLLALSSGCVGSGRAQGHSCGAADRSFIQTASVDVTALGALTADYQSGIAGPDEVAQEAFEAAQRVTHVKP